MPKPTQCLMCMEDGAVIPPKRWERIGVQFSARFYGTCAVCDGEILSGLHAIQRWDLADERTVYAHADCGAPSWFIAFP